MWKEEGRRDEKQQESEEEKEGLEREDREKE